MRKLSEQDKQEFRAIAHSQSGKFLHAWVSDLISELGDVSTVESDPIESRKRVLELLRNNLLSHIERKEPKEKVQVDNYE